MKTDRSESRLPVDLENTGKAKLQSAFPKFVGMFQTVVLFVQKVVEPLRYFNEQTMHCRGRETRSRRIYFAGYCV